MSNITTRRHAQVHDVQIKYVKEVASTENEAKTMTEKNGKHVGHQRVSSGNIVFATPALCIAMPFPISLWHRKREVLFVCVLRICL